MSNSIQDAYGADPQKITWQIVRGDEARLRIEFWQQDEVTPQDTASWAYSATARDIKTGTMYTLDTESALGSVDIIVQEVVTKTWGVGVYKDIATELLFDLQVIIDGATTWTPVIGNIVVLSDVTGSTL
jgi:hypothetical protein